ncbi:hypothetical protein Vadar_005213 [Vaccinium darrowii]|uniref:Uncharacterized protein n=1 Tax=Vaccinium darrowii TaxID=229202 RepID=A0ACB7XNA1_9ERIC|nr:hypothetical protein Vadar_005213 [Vaccinium darrowii]
MDPLSVLRDYAIRNDLDSITRVDDEFRFGSTHCFPAATTTAYRSQLGHLLTLETLIHFLKNHHLNHIDYMKNLSGTTIPTVSFIDRQPLLDYLLQGHVSSSSSSAAAAASQFINPDEFSEITLRPFDLSDVDDLMEWTTDEKVSRFCIWDTYTSREQGVDFIKNFAIPHPWVRAICLKNKAIGSISVAPGSGIGVGRAEIGYALASKYWGKGIVTRAVKMVVSIVPLEWPHLERLEALVDVENFGSQRVLEKVGFHKEGVLRKYAFIKGRSRDVVMFSLVRIDVS